MTDGVDRARVFGERLGAVERFAPGFFHRSAEAEHLARYKWASKWVANRAVLDVACGTGYGVQVLRVAGASPVYSIDISRDALHFGMRRYGMAAICSDAQALPMGTGICDAVVSLETIEHLGDPISFAQEVRRVLRPAGELLLSTPNSRRTLGTNPYHLREMDLRELRSLLDVAGFRIVGVWGQHWAPSGRLWRSIRGLRRLVYEVERIPTVIRWPAVGITPLYWCIRGIRK
jgi:2-polyprenyl-3-methyl-5-hydroxy-6-metoxy-1,4-benzoquinol methylase